MVVLALAVAALAVLLAVVLALALRLRQRLSSRQITDHSLVGKAVAAESFTESLRTQPETNLTLSLLTQSENLITQETLSDVDINPLATAPPGRITIYIVDGPSNQVIRSAVVSNLEDGDAKKKYQTYDIFKVLYIKHLEVTGQVAVLKTTDLVVVVDSTKRDWNNIVAGDEGIHEGAMVFIWPKKLWMEKQGLLSS